MMALAPINLFDWVMKIEEEQNGGANARNYKSPCQKRSRQVVGNKWEKERVVRDGAASKMFIIWTGISFPAKELKK